MDSIGYVTILYKLDPVFRLLVQSSYASRILYSFLLINQDPPFRKRKKKTLNLIAIHNEGETSLVCI